MLNAGLFLIAEVVSGNVQLRQGPIVPVGIGCQNLGVIGIVYLLVFEPSSKNDGSWYT